MGNLLVLESSIIDHASFSLLYRNFYPKLDYFVFQYLHDKELAKNIAQDVFTELWDNRNNLKEDSNLQAWLFTVAKNKSIKAIQKIKAQQNFSDYIRPRQLDADYQALMDFDTNIFITEDVQAQIEKALNLLPPQCRKIFEMSRFEDKKNREIAEELGLSIKTIEAQISKAMHILKEELKEYLPLFYLYFLIK